MQRNCLFNTVTLQLFISIIFLGLAINVPAALDPPHTGTVGCLSCHQMTSTYPKLLPPLDHSPQDIDDTISNNSCWSCHNETVAPFVLTHSSLQADNSYGDWTVECWVCHNQHLQEQNRYNSSTYGMYIRRSVNLANITGLTKTGTESVIFKGQTGVNSFADGDTTYNGICEVCHTQTSHFRNNGLGSDQLHANIGGAAGTNCTTVCHKHTDGFIHGAGGTGCETCHGHEDGYGGARYYGSTRSHSTHTESNAIGPPVLTCDQCHDTDNFPKFKSGTDLDGDGRFNLAETDVCNNCHSEGGPYDGLNDPAVGAKKNWRYGVYSGDLLAAGREKWCVTCHDSGTSVIDGRQAPDVAGDNVNYGFYISGHGVLQECKDCHAPDLAHIDGVQTYAAPATPSQYKLAYRLIDVNGNNPFNITYKQPEKCIYNQTPTDFELCFKCHSEQHLMNDTRALGWDDCTSNPYDNAASITTSFRDALDGKNIHADHLIGVSGWVATAPWDSDGDGSRDNAVTCITCHDPHGPVRHDGFSTKMMTVAKLDILWGNDGLGDYGLVGPQGNVSILQDPEGICVACHGANGGKYYRTHPDPLLEGITVADSDPFDNFAAEDGYTNNTAVTVTFTLGSMTTPLEMKIAENYALTENTTGWVPYSNPYTYTLTPGEGLKTVFAQIKDAGTTSAIKGYKIILDTTSPTLGVSTITSPSGGEVWQQDTVHDITWVSSNIQDVNLKDSPIDLSYYYSTDGGLSYHWDTIVQGEANDGTHAWTIPAVESSLVGVMIFAVDKAGNLDGVSLNQHFTILAIAPVLNGITLSDRNNADPAPAESGYTNNQTVKINISTANNPAQMKISEDPTFADTPAWLPFSASNTFTLSPGDGSKTVYCQVQNGAGISEIKSASIILDSSAPSILSTTLTAPNGGEFWTVETGRTITWNDEDIGDTNLKTNPITLQFSITGGATSTMTIASGEANDGSYAWTPSILSYYQARILMIATDKAGNQAMDMSNENFFVSPPENLIVTTTSDTDDGTSPWSLREAINNANSMFGQYDIWFNIPTIDPNFVNGTAVITITSSLPVLDVPYMTIDGGSQRSIIGDTNSYGPEIRIDGVSDTYNGIDIDYHGTGAYIRELQLTNLNIAIRTVANSTVVEDCQMGVSSDSYGYQPATNNSHVFLDSRFDSAGSSARIGNLGKGNYLSCANPGLSTYGIYDKVGTDNRIIDNVIGLKPDNTLCTSPETAIFIDPTAVDNTNCRIEGNEIAGSTYGVYLGKGVGDCTIKSNLFGLYYNQANDTWTEVGAQAYAIYLDNQYAGFSEIKKAGNNIIGGPNVATSDAVLNDSNVINPGTYGIYNYYSYGFTGYNMIYGNFIGTNPEQDQNFGGSTGIYIDYGNNTRVGGGTEAGQAPNVIAHMSSYGVQVARDTTDYVRISRNSFYDNGTEAISLVAGANEGIQPPVIAAANTFTVTVNGVASGDTVEVYRSDGVGAYGQGKTFINSAVASGTSVTVDISSAALSDGDWVTATRTNSNGSTSAFSANMQVE